MWELFYADQFWSGFHFVSSLQLNAAQQQILGEEPKEMGKDSLKVPEERGKIQQWLPKCRSNCSVFLLHNCHVTSWAFSIYIYHANTETQMSPAHHMQCCLIFTNVRQHLTASALSFQTWRTKWTSHFPLDTSLSISLLYIY